MIYFKIRKFSFLLLTTCVTVLLFHQCAKIDGVGLDMNSGVLGVNSSDTFTVNTSTFMLDPLPTGNQSLLLLGAFEDEYLGKTKSSTFFRLAQPDLSTEFTNDAQFDSLTIRLFYNGYYYGDTTKTITLNVHQMTEAIEPRELSIALEDDEYPVFVSGETLYTDQSFDYSNEAIGTTTFSPRPLSVADTVSIRLSQALGEQIFQMILQNDRRLEIEDEFLEYFKGLAIIPIGDPKAVIGFRDSIAFNVHYSYEGQSDGQRIDDEITFNIGNSTYQYNKIESDRSNTVLKSLSLSNPELTPDLTDQRTFLQGGTGIVTRVRFPNIRQTLGLGNTAINSAQLIIETDQSELGYTPPPDSLVLFVANNYGTPTSMVTNISGTSLLAIYQTGNTAGGYGPGKYVFNITDYLAEIIKTQNFDEEESLLLSLPVSSLLTTTDMLHIAQGENKPAIKLNVLYTKTQ